MFQAGSQKETGYLEKMSISVIIPAYNASLTIARAINSVINQTLVPEEIIVVDDGSTDNMAQAVKEFGNRVNYMKTEHLGPGAARNRALMKLKGDWVALLDSDDEWLPQKLELQMKLFESNPDLCWSGANSFLAAGDRRTLKCSQKRAREQLAGKDFFDNFLLAFSKNYFRLHPSTIIIKRSVFDDVGLFNEELLRNEDSDMWCRIAFKYPKFGFIPEPLVTAYLDAQDPLLVKIRIDNKGGLYFHRMIKNLFPIAEKNDCLPEYTAYARLFLRRTLIQAIYYGLKNEARNTVKKFKNLFPWYWQIGTYVLTIFPKLTSRLLRVLAYIVYVAKRKRLVNRRWLYPNNE